MDHMKSATGVPSGKDSMDQHLNMVQSTQSAQAIPHQHNNNTGMKYSISEISVTCLFINWLNVCIL